VSKVKWGGLNNPSRPNFRCHEKSNGPAVSINIIPVNIIRLFFFTVFSSEKFFLKLMTNIEITNRIPEYTKE
jgi:hypothetical protein